MKLLWFLTWREIRFRWRNLLPFVLIAAALIFTSVAQITLQESIVSSESFDYMTSPSYMIILSAFALIGFVAARTYFSLYSESLLGETGIKRALGLKRRDIRNARLLLGFLCITAAAIVAVLLALLYMYLFVRSCTSGNMLVSHFTPLVFRIPSTNILRVLLLMILFMMGGVLAGTIKEKNIVSLLRRGKMPLEAENGNGFLPEEGNLRDYGKLVVRRSLKRCAKYNIITAFLLILPMFYILGASTSQTDGSDHSFTLYSTFDMESMTFLEIKDDMIVEINEISGVTDAVKCINDKKGYGNYIQIYTEDALELSRIRQTIIRYAEEHSLKFEDSAVIRTENNLITRHYQFFFLTHSAILFAVACVTAFALLKSRLTMRKRELSLLRAIGARTEDILSAVIPETIADYIAGSIFSVVLGALSFWGVMTDGGGVIMILPIILLCIIFSIGNMFVQVHVSKRMTAQILTETAESL